MNRYFCILLLITLIYQNALNCGPNQYWVADDCYDCPAGFYCPGNDEAIRCNSNQISNPAQSSCTLCPAGSSCDDPSHPPTRCAYGHYSAEGDTDCHSCPAGYECTDPEADPVECTAGYYCAGGAALKLPCPVGKKCPQRSEAPVPCSSGEYSTGSQEYCTICPAGSYCQTTYTPPVTCPTGTFSLAGATSCTLCDEDYECPSQTEQKKICEVGEYSPIYQTTCTTCPAGYSCTNGNGIPEICPEGDYSTSGLGECLDCPRGYQCDGRNQKSVCTSSYSAGGSEYCSTCSAGKFCFTTKAAADSCEDGTYSGYAATSCTTCPIGYYCPTTQLVFECPERTYTHLTHTTECYDCPAGATCSSKSSAPTQCSSGEYYVPGLAACYTCRAGHECPDPTSAIMDPCPAGLYQSSTGMQYCNLCTPGNYCPTPASISSCPSYSYSYYGFTYCVACPPGYDCSVSSSTEIIKCESGQYYKPADEACTDCPAGYYCPDHVLSPIECPDGYYSYTGMALCIGCPAGMDCQDKDGDLIVDCDEGYYSFAYEMTCTICPNRYECINGHRYPCPITHISDSDNSGCERCTDGYDCSHMLYSDTTSTLAPTVCPAGSYASALDLYCVPCPRGYYCEEEVANPTKCSAGSYQDLEGQYECKPCPDGFYQRYSGAITCILCPEGYGCSASTHYQCPEGTYSYLGTRLCLTGDVGYVYFANTKSKYPAHYLAPKGMFADSTHLALDCPAGMYGVYEGSSSEATGCEDCVAGYFCTIRTVDYELHPCPEGYYCLESTTERFQYPCPAGTYNNAKFGHSQAQCKPCPKGFYCPEASVNPIICPQHHYCPGGGFDSSVNPIEGKIRCPGGMFTKGTGKADQSECYLCPPGFYCPDDEEITYPDFYPYVGKPGFYNPYYGISRMDQFTICPSGTHLFYNAIIGYICPAAYKECPNDYNIAGKCDCPEELIEEDVQKCRVEGYWYNEKATYKLGVSCESGYFCSAGSGTSDSTACPAGTYFDGVDGSSIEDCVLCPPGYYCLEATTLATLETYVCEAGYYCPRGSTSSTAYPCPAGTASDVKARKIEDCEDCPAGLYCPEASNINTVSTSCPAGHYCPPGTATEFENPCPEGTYLDTTGGTSVNSCLNCGLGKYCGSTGLTVTSPCEVGEYNNFDEKASACAPCPAGSYCDPTSGAPVGIIFPTLCDEGYYSDEGVSSCTQCAIGYYCPDKGTSLEKYLNQLICPAGYYCEATGFGLNVYPNLDDHGCPVGQYCTAGTTAPVNCPAGTYRHLKGGESEDDCLITDAGYYSAEGESNNRDANFTGPCPEGYFCPAGTTEADKEKHPCPKGYFRGIPGGEKPEHCAPCPSGKLCATSGTFAPANCPEGYYCPIGTSKAEPCPEGTFSDVLDLKESKECTPCTAGHYCATKGLTEPTGECDAGYLCIEGANQPEPTDLVTGKKCPAGGYCLQGATEPSPCPAGEYLPSEVTGASSADWCIECKAGYYCEGSSDPDPTGKCTAGYYCDAGSDTPTQHEVGDGYYSNEGAQFPEPCPIGTYSTSTTSSSCEECGGGYYCPNVGTDSTSRETCPEGFYCPALSAFSESALYAKIPCPSGTYSTETGRDSEEDCVACDGGHFCGEAGLSENDLGNYKSGVCAAGFYCSSGSKYQYPFEGADGGAGLYGPCPAGSYCTGTTTTPEECPIGTYNPNKFQDADTDCIPCMQGKYCATTGLADFSGDCDIGSYCPEGSEESNPSQCSGQEYCPPGSADEQICPTGFYNNDEEAYICQDCDKGQYCYNGASKACPKGFYCP